MLIWQFLAPHVSIILFLSCQAEMECLYCQLLKMLRATICFFPSMDLGVDWLTKFVPGVLESHISSCLLIYQAVPKILIDSSRIFPYIAASESKTNLSAGSYQCSNVLFLGVMTAMASFFVFRSRLLFLNFCTQKYIKNCFFGSTRVVVLSTGR
jgi:hypothetical protein